MAVDESTLPEEPYPSAGHHRHQRRRHRRRQPAAWSADQLLDPLVLVATAPMAFFPERFPREAYVIAVALLVVPYVVRKSNTGYFTVLTPMLWPLLFIAVVVLPISAWVTPSFWAVSWPEFVRFVWGMAVLLGVANWCAAGGSHVHSDGLQRSVKAHMTAATAAYFALGVAFSSVGMLALRSTSKMPLLGDLANLIPEATWLPESIAQGFNANRVAGVAVLFLPLALGIALGPLTTRRSSQTGILVKIAAVGLVFFFGAVLLLTQSRTALLASVVAVILVSVLAGRRGLIPLVVIAIFVVAALDVFGPSGLVRTFSVGAGSAATAEGQPSLWGRVMEDRNVAGRLVIWQRALHGIADQPLTGMGLAGFEVRSQEPYPAMPDWHPDPDVVHAHNLFLQTGLDMGLPGLLALVAVVAVAVWEVVAIYMGTRATSPARFWDIGLAGALCAFVVYNMLDAVTVGARPAVAYWYLLGLIAGGGAALRAAQSAHYPAYE